MRRNLLTVASVFAVALAVLSCEDSQPPTSPDVNVTVQNPCPCATPATCPSPEASPTPGPIPSPRPSPTVEPSPRPSPSPTPSPEPTPSPTPTPAPVAFCHVSNKGNDNDHNVQEHQMFGDPVADGHVKHMTDPKFCPPDYLGTCDGRSSKVVCK